MFELAGVSNLVCTTILEVIQDKASSGRLSTPDMSVPRSLLCGPAQNICIEAIVVTRARSPPVHRES